MGIFRKSRPQSEPELDKLLDGYSATRPPSATHSGIETIIAGGATGPTCTTPV